MELSRIIVTILPLALIAVVSATSGCSEGDSKKYKKLDLNEMYSTNGQKGLKLPPESKALGDLTSKWNGASNIFLVRGNDINEAVNATRKICFAGAPADRIILDGPKQAQTWLVVYWGVGGSDPPRWTIECVEMSEKVIRARYREGGGITSDIHCYYAWVPLGDAKAGKFQLELWNEEASEQVLRRMVWIKQKT